MNGQQNNTANPHAAPQRPRVFTIAALSRIAHGGMSRCAPVPYLRMSGQWLEQHGFHAGARVVVSAEDGRLVLTLADRASREMPADVAPSHSFDRGTDECDTPSN